jgi:hypothetical protein
MELHAVNKQEPTKKFVGRKGQASDEEVEENNPPSVGWARGHFVAGKLNGGLVSEKPQLFELVMVGLGELAPLPSRFFLLCRSGAGDGAADLTCFDLPITGVVEQLAAINGEKL